MFNADGWLPDVTRRRLLRCHPYFSAVDDLDQTRGLVAHMYCGHEMSLTERGSLDAWMNAVRPSRVVYSVMGYGLASRVTPGRTETFYPIMIPLSGGGLVRVGTEEMALIPGAGAAVSATLPMQVELSADSVLLIICIDRAELERCAADILGEPVTSLTFVPGMDLTDGRTAWWFKQVLSDIDDLDSGDSLILAHREAALVAERRLITSLLMIQPHNYSEKLASVGYRTGADKLVRLVEEYIEAHPGRSLNVDELAAHANCSVRALQAAFKTALNRPPTTFLRERQLRLARERLTVARPGTTTVTKVAASCGLTHHGRFAKAYQHRYGEAPSATLRRD